MHKQVGVEGVCKPPLKTGWRGYIERLTDPIYVVCIVALLRGALGQHFEMYKLHFTHVFARIFVEVEIHHQVSPPSRRRVVETILYATNRHRVGLEDVPGYFRQTPHC